MIPLKPLVFNSTPLIYLAKAALLPKIEDLGTTDIIPKTVFDEVVLKGKKIGVKDAFLIEKLIGKKVFEVIAAKNKRFLKRILENPNIHRADAEVLAMAKEVDGIAVVDDASCRSMAKVEGIEAVGTLYIIIRMFKKGILSTKEAREGLDKMISSGWWCSTPLYAEAIRSLER